MDTCRFWFSRIGTVGLLYLSQIYPKKNNEYLFEQVTTNNRKGAITCILSLILSAVAGVLSVISISTMGVSVIKSIVDDECLFEFTCYDVNGKQYNDIFDVPLYDRDGNTYSYEPEWFVMGDYVSQNGERLDGDYCYLDSDGYLVYNENLVPCEECWCDYYYDEQGNKYYSLHGNPVYLDENGNILKKQNMFINYLPKQRSIKNGGNIGIQN